MCEKLNQLPVAGGVLDQDPRLLRKMELCYEVINIVDTAKQKLDEAKAKAQAQHGS